MADQHFIGPEADHLRSVFYLIKFLKKRFFVPKWELKKNFVWTWGSWKECSNIRMIEPPLEHLSTIVKKIRAMSSFCIVNKTNISHCLVTAIVLDAEWKTIFSYTCLAFTHAHAFMVLGRKQQTKNIPLTTCWGENSQNFLCSFVVVTSGVQIFSALFTHCFFFCCCSPNRVSIHIHRHTLC